jgi:hypothetical protein
LLDHSSQNCFQFLMTNDFTKKHKKTPALVGRRVKVVVSVKKLLTRNGFFSGSQLTQVLKDFVAHGFYLAREVGQEFAVFIQQEFVKIPPDGGIQYTIF